MKRILVGFGVVVIFIMVLFWQQVSGRFLSLIGQKKVVETYRHAELINPTSVSAYSFDELKGFNTRYVEMMKVLFTNDQITQFRVNFSSNPPVYADKWGDVTYGGYTPNVTDTTLSIDIYLNKKALDDYSWGNDQVEAYAQYLADKALVRQSLLLRNIKEPEETEKETQRMMSTFTDKVIRLKIQ